MNDYERPLRKGEIWYLVIIGALVLFIWHGWKEDDAIKLKTIHRAKYRLNDTVYANDSIYVIKQILIDRYVDPTPKYAPDRD